MNVFEDLIEELKEENLLEETVIETQGRRPTVSPSDLAFAPMPPAFENSGGGTLRPEVPPSNAAVPLNVPTAPVLVTNDVTPPAPTFGPVPPVPEATRPVPQTPPTQPMAAPERPVPVSMPTRADAASLPVKASSANYGSIPAPLAFNPPNPAPMTAAPVPEPAPEAPPAPRPLADKPGTRPIAAPPMGSVGRTSFAAGPRSSFGSADKRPIVNHREYFKKRAIDEVTGLQMVDHVLSGVEREQMKIVPKPFDDLPVKKALHEFMQVSGDTKSAEHARAEFQLMQETESWYSSLSHRDRHVSVAHLRRYCETTKPALSPQALIAMGRFYRNSPFSEPVRNKFDLVMTRLFSAESEGEKRELLFPREELIAQLKDLYADWSSIQVYNAAEDDSNLLIAVLKFQDFVTEAEATPTFDELIGNDFFNRLRMFKESCHEDFFAPILAVASIEANVRIGNRYVDLITRERNGANAAALEEKYGFLHDQAISDSTGKSFALVELLKERSLEAKTEIVEVHAKAEREPVRRVSSRPRNPFWGVNKWLLGLTVFVVLVCGGVYFWAEAKTQELASTQSTKVKRVNIENSSLKEHLQSARINEETFYGIALETWNDLSLEKKEELLKKILSIGPEKGFKKVQIMNDRGKTVGYATTDKAEVFNP